MRSNMSLRAGGLAGALVAAGVTAAPAVAQAPAAQLELADATLAHGQSARVSGSVDASLAGRRAVLEYRAAGDPGWRVLTGRAVRSDGRYRLARPVPGSGT